MAVQPWELWSEQVSTPPRLELVPAPPRGGRVIPALLFVALLVGALGFPIFQEVLTSPRPIPREVPRSLPLSQIPSLDPITEMPEGTRPTSTEPLGGILFVRCTNLWAARPDGSGAHRLLSFSGISSPAFSPDARTIAFFGPTDSGPGLFMVAADGSQLTEVGSLTSHQGSIGARVTNLTWAQNGKKLAFALVDPTAAPLSGGSTIWTWDTDTGWFKRIAVGLPAAGFQDGNLIYAEEVSRPRDEGISFASTGNRYTARNLSSPSVDEMTFATAPSHFSDSWSTKHGAIVLRRTPGGDLELVAKSSGWSRKVQATYDAPSPYAFFQQGRLSVSQDAARAVVDLVDPRGDRALGILDLGTGQWTVLAYAWSGAATPAPTSSGPLGAERATRFAGDIFSSWRHPAGAAAIMMPDRDRDMLSMWRGGYMVGKPTRTTSGWNAPATIYGRKDHQYVYQHALLSIDTTDDNRVEADMRTTSDAKPLETIEDAKAFVSDVMGDELAFTWPTTLPEGTELNKKWPVDAYSWDGRTTATIHMVLPPLPGKRSGRTLNIAFGDVSFSLGCGGEISPVAGEVGDEPALFDQMGGGPSSTRQVLWPGDLEHRDIGRYSVYGELPRDELQAIADSMTD